MINEFRADLHCHSTCSDGTFTPTEIITHAKNIGLSGLSITDHDTVAAYDTAFIAAAEVGLLLIPGVEFSCIHQEASIHVLGYSFNPSNTTLLDYCKRHHNRRLNRCHRILEQLSKHGMPINHEKLPQVGAIGRPHIALAMQEKGYVKSIDEAFKLYLGEGLPCYVKGEAFAIEETIEVIHQAGGLAIIAHPHLVKNRMILNEMLKMNFDGLEGYYARFPRSHHDQWIHIAEKKGWLITGGSDFHGENKPNIPLGCSWVNEEIFNHFLSHYQNTLKQ